jgi:hypothetical protein
VYSSQTPLKPALQPHFHRFREESNLRQPFSKQGTDLTLRRPSSPSSRRIVQTGHSTGANFPRVDTDWVQIHQLNLTSTRTFSPFRCHTSPLLLKMLQTSQSRQNVFGPTISTSIHPLIAYDGWMGISQLASRRLTRLHLACSILGVCVYRRHHPFPCRWVTPHQILHSCLGHSLLASTRLGPLMPCTRPPTP